MKHEIIYSLVSVLILVLCYFLLKKVSFYTGVNTPGNDVSAENNSCIASVPYANGLVCASYCYYGMTADAAKVCQCPAGQILSAPVPGQWPPPAGPRCVDPMSCPTGTLSIRKNANTGFQYCSPEACPRGEGQLVNSSSIGVNEYCLSYTGWKSIFGANKLTPCTGTPPSGYQSCPSWIINGPSAYGYSVGGCIACPTTATACPDTSVKVVCDITNAVAYARTSFVNGKCTTTTLNTTGTKLCPNNIKSCSTGVQSGRQYTLQTINYIPTCVLV